MLGLMKTSANSGSLVASDGSLILAIDTCGPSGSVALGRLEGGSVEVLGQIELEGRSYSSTLVAAVGELLAQSGVALRDLGAIVAVNGPGSFTGVRVGLSAVKGLAEGARIPVAAVSRLEVLAAKTGVASAALDAHRHEVFLRIDEDDRVPPVPRIWGPGKPHPSTGHSSRELLAGAHELAAIAPPSRIALCDEAAALLLGSAWPAAELVRTEAPTAADALRLCAPRVLAGDFVDLALLDGHYLRRSDAEIFGEPAIAAPECP
jgi:tRNA threonylcarbamoyladenosine biosynthesis protein TsaB